MTTRDQARRTITGRRSGGDARGAEWDDGQPRLPERLAAAREAKGVDLFRAERDTKIRARYLAALENGDYSSLPGVVYTKGFLRNYAVYLGLNPDEILEQWRKERGAAAIAQPVAVVPKSVTVPRQGITLSSGMLAVVLLVLVAAIPITFLAWRLIPYLQPPTITVDHPARAVETVGSTDTSYTFSGIANPGATVLFTADGQDLDPILADSAGHWSYQYTHLHLGKNIFTIQATTPDTQHASNEIEVQIIVPAGEAAPEVTPSISVDSPEDGASFQNGAIPVSGKTSGTSVTITATYISAPNAPVPSPTPKPSATPTPKPTATPSIKTSPSPSGSPNPSASPGASGAPAPATLKVGSDGTFSTSYQLPPGRWDLAVTASNDQGGEQTVHRTVVVQYKGVQVVVRIKGGVAWIKLWKDGVVEDSRTRIYRDGETITISGDKSVWIRTGVASATYVTVNGVDYGALGTTTNPGSWRLEPNSPPKPSNDS